MTCPVCLTAVGPCQALDRRPLPSNHIEREPLTVTPIYAALVNDGLRCWRGECRDGCYYPDCCSERACDHDWLDRPESDTRECLICGEERCG